MQNRELLKGSASMLVLKMLDGQPRYGYDIARELEKRSLGAFRLQEGTLYPILHSLESDGLVKSYWQDTESRRKRKYYEITPEGRDALNKRRSEWMEYCEAVNTVMEGSGAYVPV